MGEGKGVRGRGLRGSVWGIEVNVQAQRWLCNKNIILCYRPANIHLIFGPSPFIKQVLEQNHPYGNEFNLHVNGKLFANEGISTRTHFEKGA